MKMFNKINKVVVPIQAKIAILVLFGFGLLLFFIGVAVPDSPETAHKKAIGSQFSLIDGSHKSLKKAVEKTLVVPGSMDNVETTYKENNGCIYIKMTYTSKNVFGVPLRASAVGVYNINGSPVSVDVQGVKQ